MNVYDAAQKLGKSPETVKRWIRESRLNGDKVNGKWHVIVDYTFEQHLNNNHLSDEQHLNAENNLLREMIGKLEIQLEYKERQIESLTEQISHLTQLLAVSQKSIQQLTEQNQFLLEDKRKPLWRRLFRR